MYITWGSYLNTTFELWYSKIYLGNVLYFHTYHVSDTDTLDRIDYRYVNKQLDSQMLQATQFNPTRGEYVYYQCPVMYFENCSNIEFVNLSQLYVDTSLRPPTLTIKVIKNPTK